MDNADFGGGRWRLCLDGPDQAVVEDTAWCFWTPDRTAVSEVNGLPVTIAAIDYQAFLSISRNAFEFTTAKGQGRSIARYEPAVVPFGEASDDGRAGHLDFDVELVIDPEFGGPAGAEPRLVGVMRWQCGDPPPR